MSTRLTKQRLMEMAGLKTEAQVHELDAAVKDWESIDAMDVEHIQPEDLAKHIVDKLVADKSLTQFIESLSVYNDDATPASAKPQHRRMLEDVLINIIRS